MSRRLRQNPQLSGLFCGRFCGNHRPPGSRNENRNTVLAAQSPEDAIRLAKDFNGPIHLLITDVVMPGMDGHILEKELRAIHPRIRCLFMSGYTSDIIARHGVVEEGRHFIQKPFSIEQINAKVRDILDGGETAPDRPHPPVNTGFPAER